MELRTDTTPLWTDTAPFPRFRKLERDEEVDVVVVGAGIVGLTAAYLLTLDGKRVAVVERERCAQIDTGHTSAHLTMVTDRRLTELRDAFGPDHAQAVWDAGLAAIARIDDIVRAEQIDCDFAWVPGYLHAPLGATADGVEEGFRDEAVAAAQLGFDATFVRDVPFVGGPGVRYGRQARFHPRKYLAGVARAIADRGGMIFEHTNVQEFSETPRAVVASDRTIVCDDIVLATHTPLTGNTSLARATLFQTKLALYTSYVVAAEIPRGRVPDALFWDTADPYHYIRLERLRDRDVIVFGGEDHKTGQVRDTRPCYARLERTLTAMLPTARVTHRWSGQVIETPDGLPYIGETADHQFTGTGFSGNGMTFGTLTAIMAADRTAGRTNPWAELFDPGRVKVRGGAWDYVKENKDYPYYLVRDQLTRRYRDAPICTHMGCTVEWNDAEGTWDCPCHGSRFKSDGKVIAGPAESPIEVK